MERCVIVDYGFLRQRPPPRPTRQVQKGPIQAAVTSVSEKSPIALLGRYKKPRPDVRRVTGASAARRLADGGEGVAPDLTRGPTLAARQTHSWLECSKREARRMLKHRASGVLEPTRQGLVEGGCLGMSPLTRCS